MASMESLSIEVEQRNTGDMWRNQFQSQYLEEITSKTGNFKKYPVFLKMLLSSFAKQSDSVFVDILTFQDLESLKQRKPQQPQSMTMSKLTPSNKRYLILSYIVEFDKVHYPLPLNYDENPPADILKQTIAKLRQEIDQAKNINQNNSQINVNQESLKNENDLLKIKLKKMEENLYQARQIDTNVGSYQRQIEEQTKEIVYQKNLHEQKEREILDLMNQIHKLKNEQIGQNEFVDVLRKHQDAERALMDTNKKLIELEDEVGCLITENQQLKYSEKKLKTRISQLESELQSLMQNKSTQKVKPIHNTSQSPSMRRSTSMQSRKNPYIMYRKSAEKQTPKRKEGQRKDSVESDTESSYQRKVMKGSPSASQNVKKLFKNNSNLRDSPSSQSKFVNKKSVTKSKQYLKKDQQPSKIIQLQTENEEEEMLSKRLQEVRMRNKEKENAMYTPSPSVTGNDAKSNQFVKTAKQSSQTFSKPSKNEINNSYDLNIEDRLNNLSKLLKGRSPK